MLGASGIFAALRAPRELPLPYGSRAVVLGRLARIEVLGRLGLGGLLGHLARGLGLGGLLGGLLGRLSLDLGFGGRLGRLALDLGLDGRLACCPPSDEKRQAPSLSTRFGFPVKVSARGLMSWSMMTVVGEVVLRCLISIVRTARDVEVCLAARLPAALQ